MPSAPAGQAVCSKEHRCKSPFFLTDVRSAPPQRIWEQEIPQRPARNYLARTRVPVFESCLDNIFMKDVGDFQTWQIIYVYKSIFKWTHIVNRRVSLTGISCKMPLINTQLRVRLDGFSRWTLVVAVLKPRSSRLCVHRSVFWPQESYCIPWLQSQAFISFCFSWFSQVPFGQLCLHVFSVAVIYFICSLCLFQFGMCSYHSHMSTGCFWIQLP